MLALTTTALDGTLSAGTKNGDVFRSTDGATTWQQLYTSGLRKGGMAGLATDSTARIYGALGQRVATLVHGEQSAGREEITVVR